MYLFLRDFQRKLFISLITKHKTYGVEKGRTVKWRKSWLGYLVKKIFWSKTHSERKTGVLQNGKGSMNLLFSLGSSAENTSG